MREISVLVGGAAGEGIRQAGNAIARLFNRLGYNVFVYEDYQSLIRGGHNFSLVRASEAQILAHRDEVDVLIALNQETVGRHSWRVSRDGIIIYDSDRVTSDGLGIDMSKIVRNLGLPSIVRNSVALGALAGVLGIDFRIVEDVIRSTIQKLVEANLAAAREGFRRASNSTAKLKLSPLPAEPKPLLTGNEAIALGLVRAGMKLYVAYPMTPASNILHYLAANADKLGIIVVQPENEIAVIGFAEGAAYAGVRAAVGTSGGGFALMVEHLSLAGQAELPIVIVLCSRPAPATGVPTYTEQGDLFFAMFAGHGDFPRLVLAPGDADEAFLLAGEAMNLAWEFQVPVILLADKHLSESTFSTGFDGNSVTPRKPRLWEGDPKEYRRYKLTEDGISPLAFPGSGCIVKANSYEHDEYGITVEDAEKVRLGYEKRLRKFRTLERFVNSTSWVKVYGNEDSEVALITWGSTKGAVKEVGERLGLRVVQPLCLLPFPREEMLRCLKGVEQVICVEVNLRGQLASWLGYNGISVDERILKYDGRPFTVDELEKLVKGAIKL